MKNRICTLCIAVLMAVLSFGVFAEEGEYYRLQDLAEPSLLTEAENQEIMVSIQVMGKAVFKKIKYTVVDRRCFFQDTI